MTCNDCKYAHIENKCYCWCYKKQNRVRISDSSKCNKWVNKVKLMDKMTIQKYIERIERCR